MIRFSFSSNNFRIFFTLGVYLIAAKREVVDRIPCPLIIATRPDCVLFGLTQIIRIFIVLDVSHISHRAHHDT